MLAAGVTDCVPPLDGSVYELPSLPVTVIEVALVALTVKVDDCPAVTVAGLAAMVMVGGVCVLPLD